MESEEASLNFPPDSLRYFLQEVFKGSDVGIKVASIGQAIMQTTRPRVLLTPLQMGLAVQLHHHFASRFLLDSLHHLGFCSSYHEVKKFEQNAAANQGTKISGLTTKCIQYVGDNVDHNIQMLDGHDTFHGMGIIATVTPSTNQVCVVPKGNVTLHDISCAGNIPIYFHQHENQALVDITYNDVTLKRVSDPTANLDVLWKTSLLFDSNWPSWSGTMQLVLCVEHPGKFCVIFLPMIDMSSTDVTCIYFTLKY